MSILDNIPVVDLQNLKNVSEYSPVLQEAFSQVGFVYLKNHGMDMKVVSCIKKVK